MGQRPTSESSNDGNVLWDMVAGKDFLNRTPLYNN